MRGNTGAEDPDWGLARMSEPKVARLGDIAAAVAARLLSRYGLRLQLVPAGETIPATYWGEPEAGVRGNDLYARADTPLHSILHTLAHVVCMDDARRSVLDRDCGADDAEEEAVCYLQALLADELAGYCRAGLFQDMDAWGYHFRLGSTRAWFEQDAAAAQAWLERHGLIVHGRVCFTRRR